MGILMLCCMLIGTVGVFVLCYDMLGPGAIVVAGLYLLLASIAADAIQDDAEREARVEQAAAMCAADVKTDPDWLGLSVPGMAAAAEARTTTVNLTEVERAAAVNGCFEQLKTEASSAGHAG